MKKTQVRYYNNFTDDFEQSARQNFKLPNNYKWVRTDSISRVLSAIIYTLAIIFSSVYCRLCLHMRVVGRKNLKGLKCGFFVFCNHTQPVGDVFIPALAVFPKRIYTVVSTANYGIPIIGKILPFLGALPTVDSAHGIKELTRAAESKIRDGHPVVIYPEAHVWRYYTDIRSFPETSFKFPAKFGCPAFSLTVTYKKSKIFRKPVMRVFLDGPFYPDGATAKEKVKNDISKARNSFKEMFVRDYLLWILYESNGSPRLNKVARSILFSYCPFGRTIREKLGANPMYKDIVEKYDMRMGQKRHRMDNLCQKLKTQGKEIPEVIEKQREYLDM